MCDRPESWEWSMLSAYSFVQHAVMSGLLSLKFRNMKGGETPHQLYTP
jgi:hypothetical protein